MYKTVNEVMTAICNRIRQYTDEYNNKKISLQEMPTCIDNVYDAGLKEGDLIGENRRGSEIYDLLSETIQITTDLASGGEGSPGHPVESQVEYLNKNIPNVYREGYDSGEHSEREQFDQTMARIDSTLEKTVNTVNKYIDGSDVPVTPWNKITYLDENIPNVYGCGKQEGVSEGRAAERSDFWDAFQQNGNRTDYRYAFWDKWTDKAYNPKWDFKCSGLCSSMFQSADITDTKKPIHFTHTASNNVFSNATSLETIPLLTVEENVTFINWFYGTKALKNITMSGIIGNDIDFKDCTKLTRASIESIVNTLLATVSGKTLTLNKTAVNTAFNIDVDNTATYPEGSDFYVLRHLKDNWDFNYIDV